MGSGSWKERTRGGGTWGDVSRKKEDLERVDRSSVGVYQVELYLPSLCKALVAEIGPKDDANVDNEIVCVRDKPGPHASLSVDDIYVGEGGHISLDGIVGGAAEDILAALQDMASLQDATLPHDPDSQAVPEEYDFDPAYDHILGESYHPQSDGPGGRDDEEGSDRIP